MYNQKGRVGGSAFGGPKEDVHGNVECGVRTEMMVGVLWPTAMFEKQVPNQGLPFLGSLVLLLKRLVIRGASWLILRVGVLKGEKMM